MDNIENVRHDLHEASHSLETALELLQSMQADDLDLDLGALLQRLKTLRADLEATRLALEALANPPRESA